MSPFCIQTSLVINPFLGFNNSPILEDCPCPEVACENTVYTYSVNAFDPDGLDSLTYELAPCLGADCEELTIPNQYVYPNSPVTDGVISGAGGRITINQKNGVLTWDKPQKAGEYNLAVLIKEYRQGFLISTILQDIQITVVGACDNQPPILKPINIDTCLIARDIINFTVEGGDPDANQELTLTGVGSVFNVPVPKPTFDEAKGRGSVMSYFYWKTSCVHARTNSYQANFILEDDHSIVPFRDISSAEFRVKAPGITSLRAQMRGARVVLNWDEFTDCDLTIKNYKVYRTTSLNTKSINCCDYTTPEGLGYTLIGEPTLRSFVDDTPLIIGQEFCYYVTASFGIDSETCLSNAACVIPTFDLPAVQKTSVLSTSVNQGEMDVRWTYPQELDTVVFSGPYHYILYRVEADGSEVELQVTSSEVFLKQPDFEFTDVKIDTDNKKYRYKVAFYDAGQLVGFSNLSESIYLTVSPNDNKLNLSWTDNSPWTNHYFLIYRKQDQDSFKIIDTVTTNGYIDKALINGVRYTYKIESVGTYSNILLNDTTRNFSQEDSNIPVDNEASCPPVLNALGECIDPTKTLFWKSPQAVCGADDVTRYKIYYARKKDEEFLPIYTINEGVENASPDTTFLITDELRIVGCYYVTSLDSVQYNNESEPSNIICFDNCPSYLLPNIFTPNQDGLNDEFRALERRGIEKVETDIFDRWGNLVFSSNDLDIRWNGKGIDGKFQSNGTYFYICTVKFLTVKGEQERTLRGHVQLAGPREEPNGVGN